MSLHKNTRLEPSFASHQCDLKTRLDMAKRLIDKAKPAVVDGVLILLLEMHREQMIRQLYEKEARK